MEIFIDDVLVGDCGKALVYKSKGEQARERVFELINAVLDGDEVTLNDYFDDELTLVEFGAVRDIKTAMCNLKDNINCYTLKSEEQAQQKQANIDLAKQKRKEAAKLIAEAEGLEGL